MCVAQLDRALGYGPRCREFESSRARIIAPKAYVLGALLLSKKEIYLQKGFYLCRIKLYFFIVKFKMVTVD